MSIGSFECFIGKYGSPCWHQFCLWSRIGYFTEFSTHFDKIERQRFSKIAIGVSLQSFYYDTLHSLDERKV